MYLNDLFETPEDDLQTVQTASRAAGKFQSWLSKNNETKPVKDLGFYEKYFEKIGTVWIIPAKRVGIDDPHLYLGIMKKNNAWDDKSEAFVVHARSNEQPTDILKDTTVYLVMKISDDPQIMTDVAYSINWEHFAHEYTHVLDYRRGLLRHKYNQTTKSAPDKIKYYDRPWEMNAYFQQGLRDILHDLARQSPMFNKQTPEQAETYKRVFLSSYDAFRKHFIMWFDLPWLRNMNEANKRKFEVRLYKVYELVRKTWPDMDAIKDIKAQNDEAANERQFKEGDVVRYGGEICDVIGVEPGNEPVLELMTRKYKKPFKAYAYECDPVEEEE